MGKKVWGAGEKRCGAPGKKGVGRRGKKVWGAGKKGVSC